MCAFKGIDVERASEDLKNRTLAKLPGDIARLIYLAGTREYNTGRYHHDGLAFHFTPEGAARALAACHQEIFDRLVLSPLEELVRQLEIYLQSTHENPDDVLRTWKTLKSYRVIVPLECDPLAAKLFVSNIKIALAVLQSRPRGGAADGQSAWQLP